MIKTIKNLLKNLKSTYIILKNFNFRNLRIETFSFTVFFFNYDLLPINFFFSLILELSLIYENLYDKILTAEVLNNISQIKLLILAVIRDYIAYFSIFCMIFGILLILLSFIIKLFLRFLNYYTLEILPKFYYETHPLLHILNRRGYPNLDLIYGRYTISDSIENDILKEKFGSAHDKYEHMVLYAEINLLFKKLADRYSEINSINQFDVKSKRERDILFNQITILNNMLEELKYFFRSPYTLDVSH
jgi:hypothetical protein